MPSQPPKPTTITGVLAALILILALLFLWAKANNVIILPAEKQFDVVSMLLIASTLVVTGVGVAAALITIFGFEHIRRAAIDAAKVEARTVAAEIARSVAQSVGARAGLEASQNIETTPEQAEGIANAYERDRGETDV
jgi:hypothetical protein